MIAHRRGLHMLGVAVVLFVAVVTVLLPAPASIDDAPAMPLFALMVTALVVEWFPLILAGGAEATLSVLPSALLWTYFGPYVAAITIGAAISLTGIVRRRSAPAATAACAMDAVWVGHFIAHAVASRSADTASDSRLSAAAFCLAYSVCAPALGRFIDDRNPRPDVVTSVLGLPVVVVLVALVQAHGLQALPVMLVGLAAWYMWARGHVNFIALRRKVIGLTRHADVIAKALTVERDTLAAVVDYSGDGIFTVDKDLRIRHFNPALTALTGLREEVVVGRPVEEVLGPQHAPGVVNDALRRALRERRAVRIDSSLDTPGGRRDLTTGYTAVPGPDGEVALGVGGVHDVTEAKEQARVREDFFSLITHDLRTPLTAMIGNTYLLEQELARALDDDAPARRLVGRVEEANELLLRLVNSLLELQRIESGRYLMRPQSVQLRGIVDDLVSESRAAAAERDQRLTVDGPDLRAWGDPTWCREILGNLLSNAIKYTPPGGAIDLRLESRGLQIAVSVSDTGHGLLPDEQQQLFTRYFRSKRPEIRSARGTGLGLALAKRMAKRMGGDITVRSALGAGSTFTLLLPLGDLPPFLELAQQTMAQPVKAHVEESA